MKPIDVLVSLELALPNYPGNTPFSLDATTRIAEGDGASVATPLPRHSFHGGAGVDPLPADLLVGRPGMPAEGLSRLDVSSDRGTLFKRSNARFWSSAACRLADVGGPESGTRTLVGHGVEVAGIDCLSVVESRTPGAYAGHILLDAGAIVIEGLRLGDDARARVALRRN